MSTKRTLAYDPKNHSFHFYADFADPDYVFLEIRKECKCEETIAIPIHIWETIKNINVESYDLLDASDEFILDFVTKSVKSRVEEFNSKSPDEKGLISLFGFGIYGAADDPVEDQIKLGLDYFHKERSRQWTIKHKLEGFKTYSGEPTNYILPRKSEEQIAKEVEDEMNLVFKE